MSDPMDLAELGKHVGSGGIGAAFIAALFKFVVGSGMTDLKDRLIELKADMKEQMTSVKESIERADRRHEATISELTTTKNTALAAHSRFDVLEQRIDDLERQIRRGE